MQLGPTSERLQELGVETLGIVATAPERARLYFRSHPTRVELAADPQAMTHRSYGLPHIPRTPELAEKLKSVRVNPTGELPAELPQPDAVQALNRLDGFELTKTDEEYRQQLGRQFVGHFLVDRDGIVRWSDVEGARDGWAGLERFPSHDELLAAARTL